MGDSVELPLGETLIGRDTACTLRFNDPSVSRRHVRFVRRQEDVFIEDLASTNGTRVNARLITGPLRIHDGDVVTIGTRELYVRSNPGADSESITVTLAKRAAEKFIAATTHTSRIAVAVPPAVANQRCPRCGAVVDSSDEECEACSFEWGTFRPGTPTQSQMNPLKGRRHDRHPVELHLVYTSAELEIEATTRDLSIGGVFVCSHVLDPVGTRCQLAILIDGGPALKLHGIVRRVVERGDDETGLGVEFTHVGNAERAWIEATLRRMAVTDDALLE
jgi:hypothetical protein